MHILTSSLSTVVAIVGLIYFVDIEESTAAASDDAVAAAELQAAPVETAAAPAASQIDETRVIRASQIAFEAEPVDVASVSVEAPRNSARASFIANR